MKRVFKGGCFGFLLGSIGCVVAAVLWMMSLNANDDAGGLLFFPLLAFFCGLAGALIGVIVALILGLRNK